MVMPQFAHDRSPILKFCIYTTENNWNIILISGWFMSGWGVSGGSSEDIVLCRVDGSVGQLVVSRFLRLRVTPVNSSSWLTDGMTKI